MKFQHLYRFRALPARERKATEAALFALGLTVLALKMLGLKRTLSALGRVPRPAHAPPSGTRDPGLHVRAVDRAAKGLGGGTCLSKSLALHALLRRQGIDTRLRLGIRKDPETGIHAHAWLERDGLPIIGREADRMYPSAFPAIQPGDAT